MLRLTAIVMSILCVHVQASILADVLVGTLPFKLFPDGLYSEIATQGRWLAPLVAVLAGAVVTWSRPWWQVLAASLLCPMAFWVFYAIRVTAEGLSIFDPRIDTYSGVVFTVRVVLVLLGASAVALCLGLLGRRVSRRSPAPTIGSGG